jgi:adenylylsulfate kinase
VDTQPVALTVWMTGLSGAGKSTLAAQWQQQAHRPEQPVFVLDGDVVRSGLCSDLGYSMADRRENMRRVAEAARLLNLSGVTVVCALISPLRDDRAMARTIIGAERFVEVHVDAALEVCEQRDPKGLYRRARAGQIAQFTGIDSAYEPPLQPDLRLSTAQLDVDACVRALAAAVGQRREALAAAA